ncbi:MAG: hypothetical protein IPN68_06090 [Bacteroidetes bacterium]|nr:hypothetical protein [Bacteroidota bacterium]
MITGNQSKVSEIKNTQVNIGSGKDQTIAELAELIKSIIGFKGELKWDNSKPDGTIRKVLDITIMSNLVYHEDYYIRRYKRCL